MNPDYRPYGTWALLLACILVFLRFDLSVPTDRLLSNYLDAGAATPALVATGEWWRMITANFVHFGFLHILMNGIGIFYLGPRLEFELGLRRFLTLFLVSGTVGLCFALLFLSPDEMLAGASSGLFGMLGAYMALGIRQGVGAMNYFQSPSGRAMGSILLINLVLGLVVRNISLTGHIGGFLAGLCLCLYSFRLGRLPLRPANVAATWLAFLGCILFVLHPIHRTWFLGRQYWVAEESRVEAYGKALRLRISSKRMPNLILLEEYRQTQRSGEDRFVIRGDKGAAESVLRSWGIPDSNVIDMAQAREDKDPGGIPADPWKR